MGRVPAYERRRRTKRISVWLDPGEYAVIVAAAKAAHLSMSSYVRLLLIASTTP